METHGSSALALQSDDAQQDPRTVQARGLVAQAASIAVTRDTKMSAESMILLLNDAEKAVRAVFDPICEAANAAHKTATTTRANALAPILTQKDRLRRDCGAVQRQLEDEAAAEARRRAAELEAEQKANIERQATELADAGDTEAALDTLKEVESVFVAPKAVEEKVAQTTGVAYRDNWQVQYVDRAGKPVDSPDLALIPVEYHMVDASAIGKVVKAMKDRTNIPGVRAFNDRQPVGTGRGARA
jgi:hypothetical protein